jgi:tryptophan synthase alpha chain
MNRIDKLFKEHSRGILSVYFTAGFPAIDSAPEIIKELQKAGADMIEIGIPFSDPLADGPVLQHSNREALNNGMSLNLLFNQLKSIRETVTIPLILMGYINPVLRFGIDKFCHKCREIGIDGVILPDLPPELFIKNYATLFDADNIYNIFLITPQSDDNRVRYIDKISKGFIYMVSSSATTGVKNGFNETNRSYFKRINSLRLKNPRLIGFGISDNNTFVEASNFAGGAIIGSAFVNMLEKERGSVDNISAFIRKIRTGE